MNFKIVSNINIVNNEYFYATQPKYLCLGQISCDLNSNETTINIL